jgi:hypothetical protein
MEKQKNKVMRRFMATRYRNIKKIDNSNKLWRRKNFTCAVAAKFLLLRRILVHLNNRNFARLVYEVFLLSHPKY